MAAARLTHNGGRRRRQRHDSLPLAWLMVAVASACVGHLAWWHVDRSGLRELSAAAVRKVDLYYAELDSELRKLEYLPGLLYLDPEVRELLRAPDAVLGERVSSKLRWISRQAQATDITLLTPQGTAVASSRAAAWPPDPAAENLAYRPAFQDALHRGQGRFFAADGSQGVPGYSFAQEIVDEGRTLGVGMLDAHLDGIERNWWPGTDRALAYDENGVVVLSSTREWRYRSMYPLPVDTQEHLLRTRQFSGRDIVPLGLSDVASFEDGGRLVRVAVRTERGEQERLFVMRSLTMPRTGWTVALLSDTQAVRDAALQAGVAAGLGVALLGVLALYWRVQRVALAEKAAARELLERANLELEARVEARTAALNELNQELRFEVNERRLAQERLLRTRDELVQAGKLATLGQMAAGLAHELNQPLHALRTRATNARQLLERGRYGDADRNVGHVVELADRMGRMTSQLRSFARRSPSATGAVLLRRCVDVALDLLRDRLEHHGVACEVAIDPELRVRAEPDQLEQVFINLVANAIDAVVPCAVRRIAIAGRARDGRAIVQVTDTGPGLSPEVQARLFEPFFTTKPAGEGLGLGLVISISMLRHQGSDLVARNAPGAGAQFEFTLEQVRADEHVR